MHKKQIIITIVILILFLVLGLFIANEIILSKNAKVCLDYDFGEDCPIDSCHSGSCPRFTEIKSACCPKGLLG